MTYVAFLRGINVGRANRISMADLRALFAEMGLSDAQTLIQSGNVLFTSDKSEEELAREIEQRLETAHRIQTDCILRTAEGIGAAARTPFSPEMVREAEAASGVESVYVALLREEMSTEAMEALMRRQTEREKIVITSRDVHMLLYHSIRIAKLPAALSRLGIPWTVRNGKTLVKLDQMARVASPHAE